MDNNFKESRVDLNEPPPEQKKSNGWKTFFIVFSAVFLAVIFSIWLASKFLFPKELAAIELNEKEELVLDKKLKQLNLSALASKQSSSQSLSNDGSASEILEPEAYSEEGASRELTFSEREINAILAKNTDLADKVAIDLSNDLISAKILFPVEEGAPMFGGKTLKINAGISFSYDNGKPIVILKGVSLWGVPVPDSWMGNVKNIDLVKEFGGQQGFWQDFANGMEFIEVKQGQLFLKLKE